MDRVDPHKALDRFFVLGRFYDPDADDLAVWHAHDDTGALFARASEVYVPDWLTEGKIKTFVYEGRRWFCTGRLLEPKQSDRPHQAGCRKVVPRTAYDGSVPPWTPDNIDGKFHHHHGLTGRIVRWNGEELVITNHYLVVTSPLLEPQQGRLAGF